MAVFISYSRQDRAWLERLEPHLSMLRKNYAISIWNDTQIEPGKNWREAISGAIQEAQVAVLLISPYFLASEFIKQEELPRLLRRAQTQGTRIFPLVVRHCLYTASPELRDFQAFNDLANPLNGLSEVEQDMTLTQLAEELLQTLQSPPSKRLAHLPYAQEELGHAAQLSTLLYALATLAPHEAHSIPALQAQTGIRQRRTLVQMLYRLKATELVRQEKRANYVQWILTDKGRQWSKQTVDLLDKVVKEENR